MIKKCLMSWSPLATICAGLLSGLFVYAALSKLSDYEKSRREMLNQVFPNDIAIQLTWLIPVIEVFIAVMLLFPSFRKQAFISSLILLSLFSIYITLSMSGIFGHIPCSCGGILGQMGYGMHLVFNTFFIAVAVLGIRASIKLKNGKLENTLLKGKEETEKNI